MSCSRFVNISISLSLERHFSSALAAPASVVASLLGRAKNLRGARAWRVKFHAFFLFFGAARLLSRVSAFLSQQKASAAVASFSVSFCSFRRPGFKMLDETDGFVARRPAFFRKAARKANARAFFNLDRELMTSFCACTERCVA